MQPTPPAGPRGARRVRGGDTQVPPPPRPTPGAGKFRRGVPSVEGPAALSIQRVYRGHVGRWVARVAIQDMTEAMQDEPAPEPEEEVQEAWGVEGTQSGGWREEAERYAGTEEEEAAQRSPVSHPPSHYQTSQ